MKAFNAYTIDDLAGTFADLSNNPNMNVTVKQERIDELSDMSGYIVVLSDANGAFPAGNVEADPMVISICLCGTISLLMNDPVCRRRNKAAVVVGEVSDEMLDWFAASGALIAADTRKNPFPPVPECLYPPEMFETTRDSKHMFFYSFVGKLNADQERCVAVHSVRVMARIAVSHILTMSGKVVRVLYPEQMGDVFKDSRTVVSLLDAVSCGQVPGDVADTFEFALSSDKDVDARFGRFINCILAYRRTPYPATSAVPVYQKKVSNFVNVVNRCLASVFDGPCEVLDESIANNPIRMVIGGDNSEALSRIEAASHEAGVDIMVRTVLENGVPLEYVTAK